MVIAAITINVLLAHNYNSRSIIDDSRSVIDGTRSIVYDSRVRLLLVASFTVIKFL